MRMGLCMYVITPLMVSFLYFEMALIFLALMALIILYFEMALMSTRYFQLSYLCI